MTGIRDTQRMPTQVGLKLDVKASSRPAISYANNMQEEASEQVVERSDIPPVVA